jgi:phosphoglycerate dehydrogenase-like enzyme
MKIAITCHYAKLPEDHPTWKRAVEQGEIVVSKSQNLSQEELLEFVQGADALITGTDWMRRDVIERLPDCLKIISRPAVGYDRVDVRAARERGIHVCNAPGANSDSVAELTVGLLLSCVRQIPGHVAECKKYIWKAGEKCMELKGKTMGIWGLGAIGRAVALRLGAFGMNILGNDIIPREEFCREHGIRQVAEEELLSESDFISLHMPANDDTRHMINEKTIACMKDGAGLINAARGALVDGEALYQALQQGKLKFYGADVMEEPPGEDKLFTLDNVYITPHIGANTREATEKMLEIALTNALDLLEGKECRNIVNL